MNWTDPVVLEGHGVRLEPLDVGRHWDGIRAIAFDDDLWRWTLARLHDDDSLRRYLDDAMAAWERGTSLPFVTIDTTRNRIAGQSRYLNMEPRHRKLEIGWTWVGRPFQRTHVNTAAKYLMFRHAFETLGCIRVELKANVLNTRSREAMKRIGCVEEGILRHAAIGDDGTVRDSIYYSVLVEEWPAVKARLEAWLERRAGATPGGAPARS